MCKTSRYWKVSSPMIFLLCGILAPVVGCLGCATIPVQEERSEINLGDNLRLHRLQQDIWLHISEKDLPGYGPFPSNGLLIRSGRESLLIDTPWTESQTRRLFVWAEKQLKAPITAVIGTHAHDDRLGGLAEVHRRGVATFGLTLTAELAPKSGLEPPRFTFQDEMLLQLPSFALTAWYPGPGHSRDNIVVWIAEPGILFAGCLVKSLAANSLGFIGDADLNRWPATIEAVKNRFPGATLVIPGHGEPGGIELLDHTLELLRAQLTQDRQE
jgi:metallo-beta-lactamase class B